jgi:hypothetical protein
MFQSTLTASASDIRRRIAVDELFYVHSLAITNGSLFAKRVNH